MLLSAMDDFSQPGNIEMQAFDDGCHTVVTMGHSSVRVCWEPANQVGPPRDRVCIQSR